MAPTSTRSTGMARNWWATPRSLTVRSMRSPAWRFPTTARRAWRDSDSAQRGRDPAPPLSCKQGKDNIMTEPFVSRGFRGRRQSEATARRLPPGQYETRDFPVLSAGPTPHTSLATWGFTVRGPGAPVARWTWDEFQALPHETVTTDIHCVTKWSKLDTVWEGVSVDTLLAEALTRGVESAPYVLAVSDGGYTANLPLADVTRGKACVAVKYDGIP